MRIFGLVAEAAPPRSKVERRGCHARGDAGTNGANDAAIDRGEEQPEARRQSKRNDLDKLPRGRRRCLIALRGRRAKAAVVARPTGMRCLQRDHAHPYHPRARLHPNG